MLLSVCCTTFVLANPDRRGTHVLFEDDFNSLDCEIWEHEKTLGGGGNWEFEYYTNNRSNTFVSNGVLHIQPTLTADLIGDQSLMGGYNMNIWGTQPADQCTGNSFYGCERSAGGGGNVLNPIQSARIRTVNSFSFKYGRVEVRAKLPIGDWLWPAIWLLPKSNQYGSWPASGEIDIMESRGNACGYGPGGYDTIGSTLHWGPDVGHNQWYRTHETYTMPNGGNLNQDFHTYGLYWDEHMLYTYIDNDTQKILHVNFTSESMWHRGELDGSGMHNPWSSGTKAAPFDQKYYLIINLAVGGTGGYFPDGQGNKPWSDRDPHAVNSFWNAKGNWLPTWTSSALQIDWVRVYAR